MSDLQAAARRVVAAKLIGDALKEEADQARKSTLELMDQLGAERVRVTDESGANLGSVSVAAGRVSVRVVDERAFVAWVAKNHPSELVQVVRESFKEKVLASAKAKAEPGDNTAVGPDGEVVPGLEVVHGTPYVTTRPTAEARERMRDLLRGSGLFELTSGGEGGNGAA